MQNIFSFASKQSRLPVEYRGAYTWERKIWFYVASEISEFFVYFSFSCATFSFGLESEGRRCIFTIPLQTGAKVPLLRGTQAMHNHLLYTSVQKLNGSFLMCCTNLMWLAQGHSGGQKLSGIKAVTPATLWLEDHTKSPKYADEERPCYHCCVHSTQTQFAFLTSLRISRMVIVIIRDNIFSPSAASCCTVTQCVLASATINVR